MKIFTIREFVDSLTSKLDSIHGNKGLDDYSLIVCKEAREDKWTVERIKKLQELFKENLFIIDKGDWQLRDFFDSDKVQPEDVEDVGEGFVRIRFQDDINFYYNGAGSYMNVRRIVLPPRKTVKVSDKERIYILQWFENTEYGDRKHYGSVFYNLPLLKYPSSIKDLLKWLKKKKKIKGGGTFMIWNKREDLYEDDWNGGKRPRDDFKWNDGFPLWNIKTQKELDAYNEWLFTDYKKFNEEERDRLLYKDVFSKVHKIEPTEIPLTQKDVDDFCNEYNNRFKIERK